MTRAVLALGSNLGERASTLRAAVAGVGPAVRVASGVYETPPWGDLDQPPYLNAVVIVVADVPPRSWLDRARALETEAGRLRDPGRRYGPRTLDIDVIAVWSDDGTPIVSDDPDLILPHPRAHQRAFVLRPWLDIEPYARLPGHGPVADLIKSERLAADVAAMRPCPDVELSG